MSQDNKKSIVMYQGDGSNNVFSVPMTKGKFGTISVAFVRRGLDRYEYNPATFALNSDNTLLTWTGATLNVGDFIVIQRTTTREQPFEFPNNQKHLEKSDDNLERQIQEVADKVDNALLVDPTHAIDSNKMTPLQWMATILRSVDSSVRGFKIVDSILYYSADDPNLPEGSKTWTAVLNTINVTTIREHNNYLEYSVDGGITWKNISAISVAFENITGNPEDNAVLKNALDAKQDLIPDLNGIRSGANKGKTSVQPDDLETVATTGDVADLVNVEITNVSDGQFLRYDAALGKWKNVSSTASIGFDSITGSPEDNDALKNALDLKADVETTYTKTEVDTALSGKANTGLSNLTSAGKNISNWSSNVSNCITEIPQDINLELNNGTLTLKAGSKVYVPNGAGVFDVLNISADKVCTFAATNQQVFICISSDGTNLSMRGVNDSVSGAGATTTSGYAYDTTANLIKYYNSGGVAQYDCSFPVAICTVGSSQVVSIDQVFNGFGYIGSRVFVLPEVKGLIPNGRNKDGSLKNIEFTNTIVRGVNVSGTGSGSIVVATLGMGVNSYAYDEVKNAIFNTDTGNYYNADRFIVGNVSFSNSVITLFRPKTVFHAVDYSDIAHQAMPSNSSVELTLGADGSAYTMPADGYLYLAKNSSASGQRIKFTNTSAANMAVSTWSSGVQNLEIIMLVSKNNVVNVYYNAGGLTDKFRFIYANGAQ